MRTKLHFLYTVIGDGAMDMMDIISVMHLINIRKMFK